MAINFDAIPSELRDLPQWCCWKLETVKEKLTKVPYQVDNQKASSTDPKTWTTFPTARNVYENLEKFNGICFMLAKDNGIIFIDLDHCIKDGIIADPWVADLVKTLNTYTEISQSGNGLHILLKGIKPGARCSTSKFVHDIAIFDHARQCCLTGNVLDGGHGTIESRQPEMDKHYLEIFGKDRPRHTNKPTSFPVELSDDALILKAKLAKNGNDFEALWRGSTLGYTNPDTGISDDSAADMAFMNMLAFWTGGNASQMERLFSRSGLGQRDKWRDRPDYRDRTIQKAISDAADFYEPSIEPTERPEETEAERHRREFAEANPPMLRADADRFEKENPGCKIFNCDDDPKQGEISEEDASK